ncbi:MAG: hypothetical protein KUG74_16625 [Rhodobacteraceae bacterium]|nr:hypothetical protein [Paracoccaceae bacterium]
MQRSLSLLIIGLFFGGGLGFLLAAANGVTLDSHDHSHDVAETEINHDDHGDHHDTAVSVAADENAPTLAIALHKDPMAGWNLEVKTTNFLFAPEHASMANADGEGHAHVYINGQKLGRLYGGWMHIGTLPKGEVDVTVSLNANDHSPLSVGDTLLSVSKIIQVE